MTEYTKLEQMKTYLEQLVQGIDPISGKKMDEDAVLTQTELTECFSYLSTVVTHVMRTGGTQQGALSTPPVATKTFAFTAEDLKKVPLSKHPITLTEFCKIISTAIKSQSMKSLEVNRISEWLLSAGYLENVLQSNNKFIKLATTKGNHVGITVVQKTNEYGTSFPMNIYDQQAQQFILNHLSSTL